jgi:hypothetical protein
MARRSEREAEPETAIEYFARATSLSPLDPHIIAMQAGTAFAHMFAGCRPL